jgi:hypothetical protein
MSTWINPYTQIERNAEKRAAEITDCKARIKKGLTGTQQDYEVIFSAMSYWIARTDFIGAALAAGKTDTEIQTMLVPANDCRDQYECVAIFKALIVALGGTPTDVQD